MKLINYIFLLAFLFGLESCIYPFTPEGIEDYTGVVVMEGDINSGIPSTFVPSRSLSLNDEKGKPASVDLEEICVEGENGVLYKLHSVENVHDKNFQNEVKKVYTIDTKMLDIGVRHRLVFKCDGKRYASDWLSFVKSVPIGDLSYKVADDLSYLDILVDAESDDDSLRYYKWDYKEDWEIHSYYMVDSYFLPDSNQVYPLEDGTITNYYCWNKKISSNINVFTTERLEQNVVKDHLIRRILNTDKRLSYIYSIEVYQKSISKEGYKYWETLLKNNDGLSGIFPPQPNELRGNIKCIDDPSEMVLGYISSCAVEKKRIFIDRVDHRIYRNDDVCQMESVPRERWKILYDSGWNVVNVDPLSGEVFWAPRKCVDCRVYGTKEKPSFWPNNDK